MAQEIAISASLQITKSGATVRGSKSLVIDMTGEEFIGNVQTVGTSTEAINFGDISSIGYVYVENLDDTNYIELSLNNTNTQKFIKLLAGQAAVFPAATATIYATANGAPVNALIGAASL